MMAEISLCCSKCWLTTYSRLLDVCILVFPSYHPVSRHAQQRKKTYILLLRGLLFLSYSALAKTSFVQEKEFNLHNLHNVKFDVANQIVLEVTTLNTML